MTGIHHEVRSHIQCCFREMNKIACPWDGSEAQALDKMLKHNPSWELADWLRMVSNYFHSEGVNGKRPRVWIPRLSDYARGPLDRFGKAQPHRDAYSPVNAAPVVEECMCYESATTGKLIVCPFCLRERGGEAR